MFYFPFYHGKKQNQNTSSDPSLPPRSSSIYSITFALVPQGKFSTSFTNKKNPHISFPQHKIIKNKNFKVNLNPMQQKSVSIFTIFMTKDVGTCGNL
jgi:hypothetical protein